MSFLQFKYNNSSKECNRLPYVFITGFYLMYGKNWRWKNKSENYTSQKYSLL